MKLAHLVVLLLFFGAPLSAQVRPLLTEPVETVQKGSARIEFGAEFLQDARFPLSGLEGDLSRLGVFSFRIGAGERVEVRISGTAQDFLDIDRRFPAPNSNKLDFSGDTTNDVGDVTLATKLHLRREREGAPAVGFLFAVQLPNASTENGLGNDETNFLASLLLEKSVSRLKLIGNLGVAILGDPTSESSQDDLFTYGVAALYSVNERLNLLADINGRTGPGGFGTEDQALLRLGAQFKAARLNWDVAAQFGLSDTDPDTGVVFGVSKDFSFPLFDF